ncbi:MAG: hypothetical protein IT320_03110 [Anaerolineae bacterium]|nr:hypothetical protein [Anaerolineae bacterium]
MRILIFVLSVLLFLLTAPANAQEQPLDIALAQPDLDDYLRAIPSIFAHPEELSGDLAKIVFLEIELRFGEQLSAEAHQTLRTAIDSLNSYFGSADTLPIIRQHWEHALLIAWLRESDVNLATSSHLVLEDYNIDVSRHDFDGDGIPEHILDVLRDCQSATCQGESRNRTDAGYADYVVIQGTDSRNYRLISVPLPWLGVGYNVYSSQYGDLYPLGFRDVTGDGFDEWLWIEWDYVARYSGYRIQLHILAWRDDEIVDLFRDHASAQWLDVTGNAYTLEDMNVWHFEEVAGQPTTIVQTVPVRDNWDCNYETVTRFTWDGAFFVPGEAETRLPHTFACLVRAAEQAMIDGRADAAIPLYDAALALDPQEDYSAYTRVRLALAYAHMGRLKDAHDMFEQVNRLPRIADELPGERSGDNTIPELVTALLDAYGEQPTLENLCLAAHQFVTQQPVYIFDQLGLLAGTLTSADEYRGYPPVFLSEVMEMGCDLAPVFRSALEQIHVPIDTSPATALVAKGWPVEASFHADLNADGIDEWLIWIDAETIPPALFVSTESGYRATLWRDAPGFRGTYPPDENFHLQSITLPDQTVALAGLDYILIAPLATRLEQIGGGPVCEEAHRVGELSLWHLDGETLSRFFMTSVCDDADIDDLITRNGIRGTHVLERPNTFWLLVPTTYTWDAASHAYVASALPPMTPEPTPTSEPPSYPESDVTSTIYAYASKDYDRALTQLDELLIYADVLPSDIQHYARYLRALVLEQLNRPDEALADYIAVFETAPESGWGRLAALHLEAANT